MPSNKVELFSFFDPFSSFVEWDLTSWDEVDGLLYFTDIDCVKQNDAMSIYLERGVKGKLENANR